MHERSILWHRGDYPQIEEYGTILLSLFSTPERFQLVDEALKWSGWLGNGALSPSDGNGTWHEGRKRFSESLGPIGFRQVLNLG